MTDVHFECTGCGRCCHGLKLRLTISEAKKWLERGQPVQILVDAVPWANASDQEQVIGLEIERKRLRSFAAHSGRLPCRVELILTSAFEGACPNLRVDMRCNVYDERPSICRIYPADLLGASFFASQHKKCPPEAWTDTASPLIRGGKFVDASVQAAVDHLNAAAVLEVNQKMRLCAALRLNRAAFVNEGYVIYSPPPERLVEAFRQIEEESDPFEGDWTFVSDSESTISLLEGAGALGAQAGHSFDPSWRYVSIRNP